MKLVILNGPNLNLLGSRDPAVYGSQTLADVEADCAAACAQHGFDLDFFQSNSEGTLVDKIQVSRDAAGLIINPGAYSHTSIAIHDALEVLGCPIIEVHLSNIHAREEFRHKSYVSRLATGVIVGLGAAGYGLAIQAMAQRLAA